MPKTVLVTGGSRGIGAEIVRTFAENNFNVVFCYKNSMDKAERLSAQLNSQGYNTLAVNADVAKSSDIDALFEIAERTFGAVNILINNAGIAQQKMFCDISEKEWDDMFDVHVKGAFFCCRRALPNMIHNKNGCIINISSVWGTLGASCESHYAAAKGAIASLTRSLAKEEGPSGVRVNCIAPGVIRTEMLSGFSADILADLAAETPLARIGTPQDIANTALFLASDAASFITGQIIGVDGGFGA